MPIKQKNNSSQQKTIDTVFDSISVLDLMDVTGLSQQQKNSIVVDLAELTFSTFFSKRLPALVTQGQMEDLLAQFDAHPDIDQIAEAICDYVPNYPALLAEHTRKVKREFLHGHFKEIIDLCIAEYSDELSPETQRILSRRKSKYATALGLVEQEDWVTLARLFEKKDDAHES